MNHCFGLIGLAWSLSKLLGEPFRVAFSKPSPFNDRTTMGNRQSCGAIRTQPEQVATRSMVADHGQGNLASMHLQEIRVGIGFGPLQNEIEPFHLVENFRLQQRQLATGHWRFFAFCGKLLQCFYFRLDD